MIDRFLQPGGLATAVKIKGPGYYVRARKLKKGGHSIKYKFDRVHSEKLLQRLEAFGDKCSEPCKDLRSKLRDALAAGAVGEFTFEITSKA